MKIRAYIYHKRAEKYSDCQDCFGINSQNNRIAVSDGMSQSIFPQWWAKILVDEYLNNGHIPQDILPLQKKWQDMLRNEIERREKEAIANPKRDPWRLKNLLAEKSGAGATLCGLTLGKDEWTCECLGDSCIITINHDDTLNIYTSQVGEFGNHPDYFDSFKTGRGEPLCKTVNRDVRALIMVTDPFAELFQLNENNLDFIKARFNELQNLTTHESFTELVEKWRDEFGMHNDDSTLILIEELTNPEFSIDHSDNLTTLCDIETGVLQNNSPSHQIIIPKSTKEGINTNGNDISKEDPQIESYEEVYLRFINALESLLAFYPKRNKSKKGVKVWILKKISSLIQKFIKK